VLSCSALPAAKKRFFHLMAKNAIAAGSELIAAELCQLVIDVENKPILKNPSTAT